jgi:Rho-binding antiterminator
MTMTKKYIPINCSFYDRIEAAIVMKSVVQLEYSGLDDRPLIIETELKDTLTKEGEEFVILPSGEKIRMDRIICLDGLLLPFTC